MFPRKLCNWKSSVKGGLLVLANGMIQRPGGPEGQGRFPSCKGLSFWINVVLEDESEPEEVIIIMPVSQPLPQTFDPALSLSCMAVPSLWAALGHSWTRDAPSIYLAQVAADFSSCAVLALGSVSVLYPPNARLLRTSGIFQRIQVTLDGATEQVLCKCCVMYPWDPGQPSILFSESCLPFGCHVYRMWSLSSWPRLTGWGIDTWVSVGQTSSLSWKIEMKIQRCHPFPVGC